MSDIRNPAFNKLWTVAQAAEYLGIHPKSLYRLMNKGQVPFTKIGSAVRFDPRILREWVRETSYANRTSDFGTAGRPPGR